MSASGKVAAASLVAERQPLDIVIVGGGMAGLELASALARRDVRGVAVVETGDSTDASAATRPSSAAPPHYAAPARRARLGGRSLDWHGVVLRIEDDARRDPAWPPDVIAALDGRFYTEVEADLARWAARRLDEPRTDADTTMVGLLSQWASAPAHPVPLAVRRDGQPEGAGAPSSWRAYSPLDALRAVDAGAAQPTTVCGAAVAEVMVERGAARGVRLVNGSVLTAPTVVLAAGTLENARLTLRAVGGSRQVDGLCDHLVQGFVVAVPAAALGLAPGDDGFAMVTGAPGPQSNLFARCRASSGGDAILDVWAIGEQRRPGSTVAPAAHGLAVSPRLSAADREVLAEQRAGLVELWRALRPTVTGATVEFGEFLRAPCTFDVAVASARAGAGRAAGYSWPLGWVDHESSVLALGDLLDPTGAVPGVAGLRVVGPATFPRPGAANPSLTTLALARLTAATIAAS